MKNINVGLVNYVLSKKYGNIFLNENASFDKEQNKLFVKYIDVLKTSPILMLENKIFNKLENKTIINESLAMRYIDNTINLFNIYTEDELLKEHKKIESFVDVKDIEDNSRLKLYNAINDLIFESISENEKVDVDNIHESFMVVLEHIMTEKDKDVKDNEEAIENINEHVLRIAIDKFNNKYSNQLNENEIKLVQTLIKKNFDEKQTIFEDYKSSVLKSLNSIEDEDYKDKIDETVNKINEMKNTEVSINDNILNLYELSQGLEDENK
ncbi:MAG: hypothetical protein ACOCVF_02590 [bacterium]